MKTFISTLEPHILHNEQNGCDANGQSKDIDVRKYPAFKQVSIRDSQVVDEHGLKVYLTMPNMVPSGF
jgi:hypothetical protein